MADEQTQLAQKSPPAALVKMGETGIRLSSMDDLWRFANMVSASGFAPNGMNTVEKVAIAIEYGMELGIAPMQALQGMYVVNGKPSVYGDLFLALCKSDPRWDENRFAEWFTGEPYKDDYTAHCQMARVGIANPHVESFSVADAKLAKLWAKAGPWSTNPKRMLKMRSRTFCGRDTFPERLRGLTTVEEAVDIIDVEVTDMRPAPIAMPQRTQTAAAEPATERKPRKAASSPASEPEATDAPEGQGDPQDAAAGHGVPQPATLIARIKDAGYDACAGVLKNYSLTAPVTLKQFDGWSDMDLHNLSDSLDGIK